MDSNLDRPRRDGITAIPERRSKVIDLHQSRRLVKTLSNKTRKSSFDRRNRWQVGSPKLDRLLTTNGILTRGQRQARTGLVTLTTARMERNTNWLANCPSYAKVSGPVSKLARLAWSCPAKIEAGPTSIGPVQKNKKTRQTKIKISPVGPGSRPSVVRLILKEEPTADKESDHRNC